MFQIRNLILYFFLILGISICYSEIKENQKQNITLVKQIANAGNDASICTNTISLSATGLNADELGTWYLFSGTGFISNINNPNSLYTCSTNSINLLVWEVLNTLTSDLTYDTVKITNDQVNIANAGINKTVCVPNTTLSGNVPITGSVVQWSLFSGNGTFTSANLRNTSVIGMSPGNNIFKYTITKNACSSFDTITIKYNKANAGTTIEVCSDTAVLNASFPIVNFGYWNFNPDFTFDDSNDPKTIVRGLLPGNNVLVWTTQQFPGGCPSSAIVTIISNVVTASNAGSDQLNLCSDSTILSGNSPTLGLGRWYTVSGFGNIINTTSPSSKINFLKEGTTILEWRISKSICTSSSFVTLKNNKPTKANAGLDMLICISDTILNANNPTQGIGYWSNIGSGGAISNPYSYNTSITSIPSGNSFYLWTTSFAGCPTSIDTIKITKQLFQQAIISGSDLKLICTDSTSLIAINTLNGGNWRRISGSGNIQSPNNFKTLITNITTDGFSLFEWTFGVGGCLSSRDTITINHNSVSIANAGTNKILCTDSTFMNATVPSKGNGIWNIISGNGSIIGPNLNNTLVKNLQPNISVFRWTVTSAHCSSFSNVTITNNAPTTSITANDKVICVNNDTLKANAPTQGIGSWSISRGFGNILNTSSGTSLVNNLGLGYNSFIWKIVKNGCISIDSISIINNKPSQATARTDTTTCSNFVFLRAVNPIQGIGKWNILSSTGVIFNPNQSITSVNGLNYDKNTFIWTVSFSGCPSSADTVEITNYSVTPPLAGPDSCFVLPSGNNITLYLYGNPPGQSGEIGAWRTILAPTGSINFSTNLSSVTVSGSGGTGYYKFVYKIEETKAFKCTREDTIAITVLPSANAFADQCLTLSSGSSLGVNLGIQTLKTSQGEIGRWSYITPPVGNLNSITGIVNSLPRGVHTLRYSVSNTNTGTCSISNYDDENVTIITKADIGIPSKSLCLQNAEDFTNVTANTVNLINQGAGGRGIWTSSTAGATVSSSYTNGGGSVRGDFASLQLGVNKFYFSVFNLFNPSCTSIDSLTITKTTRPNAGSDNFLILNTLIPGNSLPYTLIGNNFNNPYINENGNLPNIGETGNWSILPGNPFTSIINRNISNATVSGMRVGINSFAWTISNTISGCFLRDTIQIYVQTKAIAGTVSGYQFTNANPIIALTKTLQSPNVLASGESGYWSYVRVNAVQDPTSVIGSNITQIILSNLRRGVSIFRWNVFNPSWPPGYTNSSDVSVVVMTKAIAGNDLCFSDSVNIYLGNKQTVTVRPSVGEKFTWRSSNPIVTISQPGDSIPVVFVTGIPDGKTSFYFTITNTTAGVNGFDSDTIDVFKITRPNAGIDQNYIVTLTSGLTNNLSANSINNLNGEIGKWSSVNSGITIGNPFESNTTATGYQFGLNPLIWTISLAGCSLNDTLNINLQSKANAGKDTFLLLQPPTSITSLTLKSPTFINNNKGEIGSWSFIQSNNGINPISFTGSSMNDITLSGLSRGVYRLRFTVRNINFSTQNTSDIVITVMTKAKAGTSPIICITDSNSLNIGPQGLSISAPNIGEINTWTNNQSISMVYNGLSSIPSINLLSLPAGKTKLRLQISNTITGFHNSDSIEIIKVTRPQAGSDQFILTSSTSTITNLLNANSVNSTTGENGRWSTTISGISFNNPSSNNTSASGYNTGQNKLFWSITLGGCSFRDTVNINVQTVANAGSNVNLILSLPGSTLSHLLKSPVLIKPLNGEYGMWQFVNSNNGTIPTTTSGANFYELFLSNLSRGVYNYRWIVKNNSFSDSNSQNVTITVITKAKAGQNICEKALTSYTIDGLGSSISEPNVGEINMWTNDKSISLIYNGLSSIPSVNIGSLPIGKTKMFLKIINTITGANDTDSLLITNLTNPQLQNDISICGTNYQLSPLFIPNSALGESFVIQVFAKATNPIFPNGVYNPFISQLDTGNNIITYIISNGSCTKKDTQIVRNNQPYLSTVTGPLYSCFTSNTLIGNDPKLQFPTAIGIWKLISQPPTIIGVNTAVLNNPNSYNMQVTQMISPGDYLFQWNVINQNCTLTSSSFKITRNSLISTNVGQTNVIICDTTYIFNADTLPSNITGTWTGIGGSGIISPSQINNPKATITGLLSIPTGFESNWGWTISQGECKSPTYNIKITAYKPPAKAIIANNSIINVCETDSIQLTSVQTIAGYTGAKVWYTPPGEGSGIFVSATSSGTLFKQIGYGTNVIIFKEFNPNTSVCPVYSDTIKYTRYKLPSKVNAGTDRNICGDSIHLNASFEGVGIGSWKVAIGNANCSFTGINNPNSKVVNLTPDIYTFSWKVENGVCFDSSTVKYNIKPKVSKANILNNDSTTCDTLTLSLKATPPIIGKGKWFSLNGINSIRNDTFPNSKTIIKNFGFNQFAYVVSKEFCTSADTLLISTIVPPPRAYLGKDTVICMDNHTLTGNIPYPGKLNWSVLTLANIGYYHDSTKLYLRNLSPGKNLISYTISLAGCNSTSDTIVINNLRTNIAFAGKDTIICSESLILNAQKPTNDSGIWKLVSGNAIIADVENPKSSITNINKGLNVLKWIVSNENCPESESVINIINNQLDKPKTFEETSIFSNTYLLEASTPKYGIGHWKQIAGTSIIEQPEQPITNISEISVGENIYRWIVKIEGCDSVFADKKVILSDISLPKGFSPNNDNDNQFFKIQGIESYPNSKLEVFNRWGKIVYVNSNYNNDWAGTNSKSENLTDDTYFYVLTLPNGKIYKNYVVLKR
ncbi:MAG: gliding motility-associated C-terminal domain-containing protein [Bacteroidota bacterium]|nr:gliding motility-associated C-terminal domain-containing protein [Bacteroidota bacterium]